MTVPASSHMCWSQVCLHRSAGDCLELQSALEKGCGLGSPGPDKGGVNDCEVWNLKPRSKSALRLDAIAQGRRFLKTTIRSGHKSPNLSFGALSVRGGLSSVGPAVLSLLPCGSSGCTTADQGGSVTIRPHPRQLGMCLHLAHTMEMPMTTQAAPLKKDSSSRTHRIYRAILLGGCALEGRSSQHWLPV